MSTELRYRLVNVFTIDGDPFSGNPLCVFEDGSRVDDASMQALALQFNLSETTFLLPSAVATARVRIFTPTYEMPFAGHPTLGSAHVVRMLKECGNQFSLEVKAGSIPVAANGNRWTLTANPPTWRAVEVGTDVLAGLLGLERGDIAERPLWVKSGKEQLIVPLRSEAAVRRCKPNAEALATALRNDEGQSMVYVFAELPEEQMLARFFFPKGSAILEDPATGSATANLGGWYLAMQRQRPITRTISQGESTGRPSRLFLDVDMSGSILVGGDVIALGEGTVRW